MRENLRDSLLRDVAGDTRGGQCLLIEVVIVRAIGCKFGMTVSAIRTALFGGRVYLLEMSVARTRFCQ